MAEVIAPGDPAFPVRVRRTSNAKRLTLRLDRVSGSAVLTVPKRTGTRTISDFLDRHQDWLRKESGAISPRTVVSAGIGLPVEGVQLAVSPGSGRCVRRDGDRLLVPFAGSRATGPLVAAYLKELARGRISEAIRRHAGDIGVSYTKLSLRDPRSRWGSCSGSGNLMFSWRLAMAPPAVLNYVAAHEVAHLREMNHSRAFWTVLQGLTPDFEVPRHWLRREGASLHRYDFAATA